MSALPYYHDDYHYSCQTFFSKDDGKKHFIIYRSMSGKVLLTRTEYGEFEYPFFVHLWIVYPHHTLVRAFTWCACADSLLLTPSEFFSRVIFTADIVSESIEEYQVQIQFQALASPMFFKTLIHFCLSTACILRQHSCSYNVPLEQCPYDIQRDIESTKAHAMLLNTELFTMQSVKAQQQDDSFESLHFFSVVIDEKEQREVFFTALKLLTCTQCVFDWNTKNTTFYSLLSCTLHVSFLYVGSMWKERLDDFVLRAREFLICTGFGTQPLQASSIVMDDQEIFFLKIMEDYRTWLYEQGASLTGVFFACHGNGSEPPFHSIVDYAAQENMGWVVDKLWMAPPKKQCLAYFQEHHTQLYTVSTDSSLFFLSDNIGKYQAVKAFFQKHANVLVPSRSVAVFKRALLYCEKLESIVPLLYSVQTEREQVFNIVLEMFSDAARNKCDEEETEATDSNVLVCNTIQTLWSQQETFLQSKLPAHVFFSIQDFVTKGDHSSLTKLYSLANKTTE
jgi:hypothetical protein